MNDYLCEVCFKFKNKLFFKNKETINHSQYVPVLVQTLLHPRTFRVKKREQKK
jgi:hypothetical protein